jgi:hypothetical protein
VASSTSTPEVECDRSRTRSREVLLRIHPRASRGGVLGLNSSQGHSRWGRGCAVVGADRAGGEILVRAATGHRICRGPHQVSGGSSRRGGEGRGVRDSCRSPPMLRAKPALARGGRVRVFS